MRDLIKNIIREHSSNEILDITVKDLKILQLLTRELTNRRVNNLNVHHFIFTLKDKFGIVNPVTLTKLLLVSFFNGEKELRVATENKDPKSLYRGPFYSAHVEYWGDINNESGIDVVECDECGGDGETIDSCGECGGDGTMEYQDYEEPQECETCDGEGNVDITCYQCNGSGDDEREIEYYIINNFRTTVITTQPLDIDDLSDGHPIVNQRDDLMGVEHHIGEEVETEKNDLMYNEGEVDGIYKQMVIIKGTSIIRDLQ